MQFYSPMPGFIIIMKVTNVAVVPDMWEPLEAAATGQTTDDSPGHPRPLLRSLQISAIYHAP